MHNVANLPYYAEILAFVAFSHLFIFRIVRNDVNKVFISLKAFYKSRAFITDGVNSIHSVVAKGVKKYNIIINYLMIYIAYAIAALALAVAS